MGEFIYVCDLGQLKGVELVVPFGTQAGLGGMASVVVLSPGDWGEVNKTYDPVVYNNDRKYTDHSSLDVNKRQTSGNHEYLRVKEDTSTNETPQCVHMLASAVQSPRHCIQR